MNIFKNFQNNIKDIITALSDAGKLPADLELKNITTEAPRDASHGDIATNAAMVLVKQAKMKPRDIAQLIEGELIKIDTVESVEIAGPGFINIRLNADFIQNQISEILDQGLDYGRSDLGANEKVNVEYVSVNPTGPLHVGHCRGAVFGDALATLLDHVGYDVTREYYINDAGGQIDVLARSAYLRYLEALGEVVGEIPEGLYPGAYLIPVGEALAARDGDKWKDRDESEWLLPVRSFATDAMMNLIREDLNTLDIQHDVFFSELSLHENGGIQKGLEQLEEKGLIYTGVLEPPKGKLPDDWEERPQTLFKSTDFGDDVDRALKKSDGAWTYFAADVAYHSDKVSRGFNTMIDVWGADHGGYVKRVQSVITALSDGKAELDVRLCQMVKLLRDGEPVKMSKRSGNFITLRDIVDEVGKDVVRFIMLTRKNDASLEFDFTKVTEQSKDNPVFYVQYGYARVSSVMKKAAAAFADLDISEVSLAKADLSLLNDESELKLIKTMVNWPRIVESAALAYEPHRISYYLYDLASEFHALWNKGNDRVDLRFIIDNNKQVTLSRLAMIKAFSKIIASGLNILGVEPLDEM
ncbi:MAG: arginine--tRNA ligase [Kordiimonadaceae bacterium]|jgi:arginyl-tRNA synthetase|nr:arginine--tRNA ligase [Kordiimonadaceae bacterium]MBT6036248.1 arginine--tRNA ligase [Kordiimonadaceae bacterium]